MDLYDMTGNPFVEGSPFLKKKLLPKSVSMSSGDYSALDVGSGLPAAAGDEPVPGARDVTPRVIRALPRSAAAGAAQQRTQPGVAINSSNAQESQQNLDGSPVPPVERDSLTGQRAALMKQLDDLSNQAPDYSQVAQYARQRSLAGQGQLGAAVLAGVGPSFARSLQPGFMKEYERSQTALPVEGGIVGPQGQVVMDPGFQSQKKEAMLLQRIQGLNQALETARNNEERNQIMREANQTRLMIAAMAAGNRNQDQLTGQAIGRTAEGRDVFRTKHGIPFIYNDAGQQEQYGGKLYERQNLAQPTTKQMNDLTQNYQAFDRLGKTWHQGLESTIPTGVTGALETAYGRFAPDWATTPNAQARATWWQNYWQTANLIRNSLFGSALTLHEEAAFNAANIREGMNANQIATNLAQQQKAIGMAIERHRAAHQNNFATGQILPPQADVQGAINSAPQPGTMLRARPAPGSALPNSRVESLKAEKARLLRGED